MDSESSILAEEREPGSRKRTSSDVPAEEEIGSGTRQGLLEAAVTHDKPTMEDRSKRIKLEQETAGSNDSPDHPRLEGDDGSGIDGQAAYVKKDALRAEAAASKTNEKGQDVVEEASLKSQTSCRFCHAMLPNFSQLQLHLLEEHQTEVQSNPTVHVDKNETVKKVRQKPDGAKQKAGGNGSGSGNSSSSNNLLVNTCAYQCGVCQRKCDSYELLLRHAGTAHKMDMSDIDYQMSDMTRTTFLRCQICSRYIYCDISILSHHIFHSHQAKSCLAYFEEFPDALTGEENETLAAQMKHHSPYRAVSLDEAEAAPKEAQLFNRCLYKCGRCKFATTNYRMLTDHATGVHSVTVQCISYSRVKTTLLQCQICQHFVYCDRSILGQHIRTSHGSVQMDEYCQKYVDYLIGHENDKMARHMEKLSVFAAAKEGDLNGKAVKSETTCDVTNVIYIKEEPIDPREKAGQKKKRPRGRKAKANVQTDSGEPAKQETFISIQERTKPMNGSMSTAQSGSVRQVIKGTVYKCGICHKSLPSLDTLLSHAMETHKVSISMPEKIISHQDPNSRPKGGRRYGQNYGGRRSRGKAHEVYVKDESVDKTKT